MIEKWSNILYEDFLDAGYLQNTTDLSNALCFSKHVRGVTNYLELIYKSQLNLFMPTPRINVGPVYKRPKLLQFFVKFKFLRKTFPTQQWR